MKTSRISAFFLSLLACVFVYTGIDTVRAQDETAHLEFQKTATSQKKKRPYTVKRGEWLFHIMRTQAGITSHRNTIIKALNPHIKDINKIEPGDVIYLPDREPAGEGDSSITDYTIKKGDSISRIAIRQLQVELSEVQKTVNEIKRLNPNIKNYNLIYPGQSLRLPRRSIVIAKEEAKVPETEPPAKIKEEAKEKPDILPETRLAIIAHIIGKMNGALTIAGTYYIPLPQTGQVTIDCSKIPVVELDDGSTYFLDFFARIPDTLKNMIRANWKNYHTITVNPQEDTATILKNIIDTSNTYTMTKNAGPIGVGANPIVTLSIDWIIKKKDSAGSPYSQGLSFVTDRSQALPRQLIAYAEKNGLIVTEIMDGQGVTSAPDETYAVPLLPALPSGTNMEFADALITSLGYQTVKDTEVKIFETAREGYNLSIKADILVKQGDKQIIFLSRKIPQQFIDTLRNKGTEVALFEQGDTLKSVIGKVLQAINAPYSYEVFPFSLPEKADLPKAVISLPAFKISRDKGHIYLTEIDIDRDIYGLLHNKWEVNIIKY